MINRTVRATRIDLDSQSPVSLYRFFDFAVRSEVALPELPQASDLEVRYEYSQPEAAFESPADLQRVWDWKLPSGEIFLSVGVFGSGHLLRFPGGVDFEFLDSGRRIRGYPADGVDAETTRHLLLDHVLPRLESHAGRLVLHGSAVADGDRVLIFLGATGSGKSTLAASFLGSGWKLLTDDCVHLRDTETGLQALAAYPSLRLWPESVDELTPSSAVAEIEVSRSWKTRLPVGSGTIQQGAVQALFTIDISEGGGAGQEVLIAPVERGASLTELLKHGFLLNPKDRQALAGYFASSGSAMRALPLYRLSYPREFSRLEEVRTAIERLLDRSI